MPVEGWFWHRIGVVVRDRISLSRERWRDGGSWARPAWAVRWLFGVVRAVRQFLVVLAWRFSRLLTPEEARDPQSC
jgi:hypothetical protein